MTADTAETEQANKDASLVLDAMDILDDLGGTPDDLRAIADWLDGRWPLKEITPLADHFRTLLFWYGAKPQALRELAKWGDTNFTRTFSSVH